MHFTIIEDNCLLCPLVIKKILRCWFRSNCSGSGGILSVDRGPEICIFLVCKYRRYVEGHFSSFPSNMIVFEVHISIAYVSSFIFLFYSSSVFGSQVKSHHLGIFYHFIWLMYEMRLYLLDECMDGLKVFT